ncbi:YbaB/EbfC family DNA-binding protein, partial [Burkholderia sp. Se-20378]|nr:YbaB/EbfC family DNA-binding protein [Burkholderia sp. Se-20378]
MKRMQQWGVSGGWRAIVVAWVLAVNAVSAVAQTADVPQTWIRYGQLAGQQFQTWLEADGDAADRLHRYLEARVLNASAAAPPPAIVVRAWI